MKYRKMGLRMCIISIIMIALCIPNQIQIANAAEGDNITGEVIVKSSDGEWTSSDAENLTTLNIFPKIQESDLQKGKYWNIEPGDIGEYKFWITNQTEYKMNCTVQIESQDGKEYPIEYQLYNEKNTSKNLLGSDWMNPSDTSSNMITSDKEKIGDGKTENYTLKWRFKQEDSEFEDGIYKVKLKVKAEQTTDSSEEPVTPPDPDNPDQPDKPDTPDTPDKPDNPDNPNKPDNGNKDDNKGDNNNSNNNGSNSNGSQNGNNSTSNDNKGNNTNNGSDESKGNDSSNNNNQNSNQDNLNIDKTSSKGTGSTTTNKKKVNTSDITTPVIYVALMILTFGLILLVRGRKES